MKKLLKIIRSCILCSIYLIVAFVVAVSLPRLPVNDFSRLIERHGDLISEDSTKEIDIIDWIDYNVLKSKADAIPNGPYANIYTELELFDQVNFYLRHKADSSTTLYAFIVQYQRPHMLEAVKECNQTNDIELCYSALNEYERLNGDKVVDLTSYKKFVEKAVHAREQLRIEREQQEKEEARLLDEKRRTKLYSCIETGDNLTCTKVKD